MQALFQHTASVLKQNEFETLDYSKTVTLFHAKMTEGMKKVHNVYCQNFFKEIVRNTPATFKARNKTTGIELRHLTLHKDHASEGSLAAGAAQKAEPEEQAGHIIDSELLRSLMEVWKELDKVLKHRMDSSQDMKALRLLISFDEAHELAEVQKATEIDSHPWSTFTEPQATLRALINCSIFSIFLSTTGRFSQSVPLSWDNMSAWVYTHMLKLIPPFCDTRMDLLPINEDKKKLTNYHAGVPVEINMEQATVCLGFRLPFEFLCMMYISQDTEFKQVEGYLHICLKPHLESESMVTISPSEPFVLEATAALLCTTKWKKRKEKVESIQVLKNLMTGFSIHAGDYRKFIALLLLTLPETRQQIHVHSYSVTSCDTCSLPASYRVVLYRQ
ncbi:hypothetical protein IMY05_C4555000200 [Salix suchowensis]|nr:hypothetical protein IMY05_C4555000200 [Salix suchowensis]